MARAAGDRSHPLEGDHHVGEPGSHLVFLLLGEDPSTSVTLTNGMRCSSAGA
jgi:hypothetical protein